jgi:hypothetical protein
MAADHPQPRSSLASILLSPEHKEEFVSDSLQLIEAHVAQRRGLKGITMRTGLAMLRSARPGLLRQAIEQLLPELIQALQPLYFECSQAGKTGFGTHLRQCEDRATQLLLATADRRAAASASAVVRANYKRFRGMAEEEVRLAMPAMAQLIDKYVGGPTRRP